MLIVLERSHSGSIAKVLQLGEVKNRNVVIYDDMCDTFKTLLQVSLQLKIHGALRISVIVVHGIFSDESFGNILKSPIETLIVSNSTTNYLKLFSNEKIMRTKVIDIVDLSEFIYQNIFNNKMQR